MTDSAAHKLSEHVPKARSKETIYKEVYLITYFANFTLFGTFD